MLQEYNIVYKGGSGEISEKKSQFISNVFPIDTEEAALTQLEQIKKRYWNATHNCYAYVLGDTNQIQRFSDDGEPSGTAGKPILDVLLGEGVHNALIIVTRYFGGTLLGTGGLVRAYGRAAKEGLLHSIIVRKCPGKLVQLSTDYNGIGKIQYISNQMSLHTIDTIYADNVVVTLIIPLDLVEAFTKNVIEATSAKAQIQILNDIYYARFDKDTILLD